MLKHLKEKQTLPSRVVILGAAGFVASATEKKLSALGVQVLGLSRSELDLTNAEAGEKLSKILLPSDTLLFVSAKAPVKNEDMLIDNLKIGKSVCEALRKTPVGHVVYISSDAVYADSSNPLNETSHAQPGSLHGVMHLAREIMLSNAWNGPLCFLRPTLIYGKGDPHNGYGPNRFMRLAAAGENIILFGEGEERRNHVWIEDVAEIICRTILHQSEGVLNIATGKVTSFREIAEITIALLNSSSKIIGTPRVGALPHNGYRAFDEADTKQAFPGFEYTVIKKGLESTK